MTTKETINLQDLIETVIVDYQEILPTDVYSDYKDEGKEIEHGGAIWALLESAIEYAVEQTIEYLKIYNLEEASLQRANELMPTGVFDMSAYYPQQSGESDEK